jgi:uncharacterized membrane protein
VEITLQYADEMKRIISALTFFLLFVSSVQASTIGSLQKKSYDKCEPGKSVEFTVLMWNLDSSQIPVHLKVRSVPEDWAVIIRPSDFNLTQNMEENYEYVVIDNKYVKALPIKVFVKVPSDAESGNYEIIVNGIAGNNENAISVIYEKNFKFDVEVMKELNTFERIKETVPNIGNNSITGVSSAMTNNLRETYLTLVSIIIIFFSWVIYKYV